MAVRSTQDVLFALTTNNLAYTQVTQIVAASLVVNSGGVAYATQVVLESLSRPANTTPMHVSQIVIEALLWNYEAPMPPIFPTLPGLTYSVIKRPMFYTGIASSTSGREVRVSYAATPTWEWDLTWNYLPDMQTASSLTASDLKQLMGFYLSVNGAFSPFLFKDPDDHLVVAQVIGSTDGTTILYTLPRTYGGSDGTGTEFVGYVDTTQTFNLYVAGTLQDPSTYDLLTTLPMMQQVRFHSTPSSGHVITCDMTYYYYCRFKDDHYDFEKFMDKLWSQQMMTLHSVRN